jgi:hypothetical protein
LDSRLRGNGSCREPIEYEKISGNLWSMVLLSAIIFWFIDDSLAVSIIFAAESPFTIQIILTLVRQGSAALRLQTHDEGLQAASLNIYSALKFCCNIFHIHYPV